MLGTLITGSDSFFLESTIMFGVVSLILAFSLYVLKFAFKPIAAAVVVGFVLLLIGMYNLGASHANQRWEAKINEANQKIAALQEEARLISKVVQTKVVTEIKYVRNTRVVYKERIKKVAVKINNQCTIAPEVNEILNEAAQTPELSVLKEKFE